MNNKDIIISKEGYDELWLWFSLSYASWLTLPRVLMHEMPDEWQMKMAMLLREWDETWIDTGTDATPIVSLKKGGKFIKVPEWIKNYRHPDKKMIEGFK